MPNPLAPFQAALRARDLRLLLGALAASQAGDWLYNLVVPACVAGIAAGALLAPLCVSVFGLGGSLILIGGAVMLYAAVLAAPRRSWWQPLASVLERLFTVIAEC